MATAFVAAGALATASELITPLPPRAMPRPPRANVARQPLAPVTGQHAKPRACDACRGDCRGGTCPANCPVRPDEFGFYETQWRTWPSVTTRQPAAPEAVTPVSPPKSEVPSADEESLPLATAAPDFPADTAAPLPAPRIPVPDRRPQPPAETPRGEAAERDLPAPSEPEPLPQQEEEPAAPAKPALPAIPAVPAVPPEEENLFDEAGRRLPRAAVLAVVNSKANRQRADKGRAAQRSADQAAADASLEPLVLAGHEEPVAPLSPRGGNPLRSTGTRSANPLR